jgi:hypothetical protein
VQCYAAKTASRYVDDEVVQRLLKAMDFSRLLYYGDILSNRSYGPT